VFVNEPHVGLRVLRVAKGITQAEAATACGVSAGYWSEVESGRRVPKAADAERIEKVLGFSTATATITVEVPGFVALAAGG
jgi:transcriptional regulator with XRE-family HTH domain